MVAVFFLCPVTDISVSATLAPIAVKFCMVVHINPGQIFHLMRRYPQGPKIRNFWPKFWPYDREYLENVKSQRCQLELTSARRRLTKNVSHRAVALPSGVHPRDALVLVHFRLLFCSVQRGRLSWQPSVFFS